MDPTPGESHLACVAQAVSGLCSLPAVATTDWTEKACTALGCVRPGASARILVGEFDDSGVIRNAEARGIALGSARGAATRHGAGHPNARSMGWWIENRAGPGGVARVIRRDGASKPPTRGKSSDRLEDLGVDSLLAALVPLADHGRRMAAVEIWLAPGATPPLDEADAMVLGAVLPVLRRQAALAFGATPTSPINRITQREQVILEHLSLGRSVKEIAETLSRSPHTVHDHVKSLHRKLGVSSRGELIARALGHVSSDDESGTEPVAAHSRSA